MELKLFITRFIAWIPAVLIVPYGIEIYNIDNIAQKEQCINFTLCN